MYGGGSGWGPRGHHPPVYLIWSTKQDKVYYFLNLFLFLSFPFFNLSFLNFFFTLSPFLFFLLLHSSLSCFCLAKRMGQKTLDNVKYIKEWEKKYGFSGKLQVEECKKLVEKIEAKSKLLKKQQKKEGYTQAKAWLDITFILNLIRFTTTFITTTTISHFDLFISIFILCLSALFFILPVFPFLLLMSP